MKRLLLLTGLIAGSAFAQTPEVAVFADLRPTVMSSDGTSRLKLYDFEGRHSMVGLNVWLENGLRIYAAQRLQRISASSDQDIFDSFFVEDPGHWRVGKQLLPFGQQSLVRESALAARYNAELLLAGVPFEIAVADNGAGETRGLTARLGPAMWGISYATGSNFTSQATSLTQLRSPNDASGRNRGYSEMYGGDLQLSFAGFTVGGEALILRGGETALDPDMDITDVWVRWSIPVVRYLVEAGWTREWLEGGDSLRATVTIPIDQRAELIPYVRVVDGSLQHFGLTTRFRF